MPIDTLPHWDADTDQGSVHVYPSLHIDGTTTFVERAAENGFAIQVTATSSLDDPFASRRMGLVRLAGDEWIGTVWENGGLTEICRCRGPRGAYLAISETARCSAEQGSW